MAVFRSTFAILLIIFSTKAVSVLCSFEFTNFNCTSLDKTLLDIDECFLKSVNRTYKYLSFRTKIHHFPITDVSLQVQVFKKLNGYRPFLFNFTVDGCKFMKGKKNQMTQFFFETFASYSNMIHPCPYTHDFYVEKLPISHLNHLLSNVLPAPEGSYMLHSIISMHGIQRMDLKIYMRIY